MENDESQAQMTAPTPPTPPRALLDPTEGAPELLQGGPTPAWRTARGILRAGSPQVIEAQQAGVRALASAFPTLADQAPLPLAPPRTHGSLAWLLEADLGTMDPEPLARIEAWTDAFLADRAERVPKRASLRELARELAPWSRPKPSVWVRSLREARGAGAALPFVPRLSTIERGLDHVVALELTRTWGHSAISPARMLERGACHWRHFGPEHWLGVDHAPFVDPDPAEPATALMVLLWGWRWDALRAADALVALGAVPPTPLREVSLSLVEPHPCLNSDDLERLLGVRPGLVPATAAARALGRGQGLVVAGVPLQLRVEPPVQPRRSARPWRIRDRDPTRLFSRWHEGVRLDPTARASLTPERAAMATARSLGATTVVDAFCGAGGNAIAFARMPWCEQVVAVEQDPERLAMARHNAAIYGVQDRIRFVCGDFFAEAPALARSARACFLDPPWAAGPELAERAWAAARSLFARGAMKLPRQATPPADADRTEAVFGVGPVISWVQAWWGSPVSGQARPWPRTTR